MDEQRLRGSTRERSISRGLTEQARTAPVPPAVPLAACREDAGVRRVPRCVGAVPLRFEVLAATLGTRGKSPTLTTTSRSDPASKVTQAPLPPSPAALRSLGAGVVARQVPCGVNGLSKVAVK